MDLTTISPMLCFVGKDSSRGGGIRVAYAGDHMQLDGRS